MKQREIIVNHRHIGGKLYHCFDNENYELLELERKVYINENERLQNIINEIKKYCVDNIESDSFTTLTSGKTTDIGYCIVVFEDILNILKEK